MKEGGRPPARIQRKNKAPEIINVELNMEEPPLFAGQARQVGGGYLEHVQEYKKPSGEVGKRIWRWKPPDEYGDLHIFDQDVYMAMHALAQEKLGGMPEDGKIPFTLYEIINILGLKDNGKNYARVRGSILKINKTLIDAVDAFYHKDKRSYESEHFIMWRVHFEGNEDKHGRATERHTLRFDELLVRSHKQGHLKQLDVNFYLSLEKSYAKSLYKRIDYQRGGALRWSEDVMELKDLIGMAQSYRQPSKVKEKLEPAHEQVKRKGFSKSSVYEGSRVLYEVSAEFMATRAYLDRSLGHEERASYRALVRNGMWANVARELVAERGAETCNFYVQALPYQKNVRDAGAWLRKYIKDRLPLPVEPPQRKLEEAELAPSAAAFEISPSAPEPVADPEAEELWGEVLSRSAEDIDAPSWRVWFKGTVPVAVGHSALTISVPNPFAEEYIEGRFKQTLENHLRDLRGEGWSIRIVVAGREGEAS